MSSSERQRQIDPDLLWKEDRDALVVLLDHLEREGRYKANTLADSRRMIRVDREELERIMVTYCSRIRQQMANEAAQKRPPPDKSDIKFGTGINDILRGEQ